MQKQTQVTVQGLALNPNPFGNVPPGTLSTAENVFLRRTGVLQPMPKDSSFGFELAEPPAVKIFAPWTDSYFAAICKPTNSLTGTVLRFSDSGVVDYTNVPLGTSTRTLQFDAGDSHATVSRTRQIFTEHSSPVCVDHTADPHSSLRVVGLPPPVLVEASAETPGSTDFAIWQDTKFYAYKGVFKRVTDDYEIVSAPSFVTASQNTTGGNAISVMGVIFDPAIDPVVAGDYVVFYRSVQADTLDGIGDDFREVFQYQLTSADIAAGIVIDLVDSLDDSARGAPLYSNSEQEGADQVNLMPPPATDVATYQDTVFYASKNTWPIATLNIPGRFGELPFTSTAQRVHGIGRRDIIGDTTISVSEIQNVALVYVQGLALGQLLTDGGGQFPVNTAINAITETSPGVYTLSMSAPAAHTTVGTTFEAADTIIVRGFKDGSLVSAETVVYDSFLFGRLAVNLAAMPTLPGIRLLVGGVYDDSADHIDGPTFAVWSPISGQYDSLQILMTNGPNYSPSTPVTVGTPAAYSSVDSVQDTRRNRLFFAKTSLPEAVAPVNWVDVGSETLLKIWPAQSALMVAATDGLWRVTGAGNQWSVDQVERNFSLVHPDCVNALDGKIHTWTDAGLAIVTENGSEVYSTDAVGTSIRAYAKQFRELGAPYIWGPCLAADNLHKEVWLNLGFSDDESTTFSTSFVWNSETGAFTNQTSTHIQGIAYVPYLQEVVTSAGLDFFQPAETGWKHALVVFNPISAGDLGYLKQWTDINWFFDDFESTGGGGASAIVQLLWDGETSSAVNEFTATATTVRGLHSWVPRRCALKNKLIVGFTTPGFGGGSAGSMNFSLFGFSVRFRVASETLKR